MGCRQYRLRKNDNLLPVAERTVSWRPVEMSGHEEMVAYEKRLSEIKRSDGR